MMGERRIDQSALFYEFSLERHVPADHTLRAIDHFVELGRPAGASGALYSATVVPRLIRSC